MKTIKNWGEEYLGYTSVLFFITTLIFTILGAYAQSVTFLMICYSLAKISVAFFLVSLFAYFILNYFSSKEKKEIENDK